MFGLSESAFIDIDDRNESFVTKKIIFFLQRKSFLIFIIQTKSIKHL